MSEDDLHKFVGVLFLSGYYTLPQQQLYWDEEMMQTPLLSTKQ